MAVVTYDLFSQADGSGFAAQTSAFAKLVKVTYEKPFLEALARDTTIFNLFPRKNTTDGYVRWKVKYSGNTGTEFYEEEDAYGAGIGMTGAVADSAPQLYENAEVLMRMARVNVKLSNLAVAAKGSSWVDIQADEIEGSLDDLKSGLNDAMLRILYGSDTRRPESLGSIIGDGASTDAAGTIGKATYAGITRNGSHWFSSVVNTGSGTARPLTAAQMADVWARLLRPARKANIRHILTSPGLSDAYADIMDGRRRWVAGGNGQTSRLDVGYDQLHYKGVPITVVQNMPDVSAGVSNRMYFIDPLVWNVAVLKSFETDEIATTNDTRQLAIKMYFSLVCKAPYKQAVISDLASTY